MVALDGIDVEFPGGRIVALLGDNGAGKTTLARVLAGILQPDDGHVAVDGLRLRARSATDGLRAGVGLVHQHAALFPSLTVAENLALTPRTGRADPSSRALSLLSDLGVGVDPRIPVGDLPLGTRLFIELARTLAIGARYVILDEPTAALDAIAIAELLRHLRRLRDEGVGIILVTHKLPEVLAVASDVVVLRAGRVSLAGSLTGVGPDAVASAMDGSGSHHAETVDAAHEGQAEGRSLVRLEGARLLADGSPFDLDVRAGEVLAILGMEGNGQRELARLLADSAPQAGHAAFLPADRTSEGLSPSLRPWEHLALSPRRPGSWVRSSEIAEIGRHLVMRYGLPQDALQRAVMTLSGGQQQRVLLARTLDERPSLLIAMNPLRGLDVSSRRAVSTLLTGASRSGAAVVVFLTDPDEAAGLADRWAVLFHHRLGPVRALTGDWRRQTVRAMAGLGGMPSNHAQR